MTLLAEVVVSFSQVLTTCAPMLVHGPRHQSLGDGFTYTTVTPHHKPTCATCSSSLMLCRVSRSLRLHPTGCAAAPLLLSGRICHLPLSCLPLHSSASIRFFDSNLDFGRHPTRRPFFGLRASPASSSDCSRLIPEQVLRTSVWLVPPAFCLPLWLTSSSKGLHPHPCLPELFSSLLSPHHLLQASTQLTTSPVGHKTGLP